jgi:hypothetical protein
VSHEEVFRLHPEGTLTASDVPAIVVDAHWVARDVTDGSMT